MSFEKDAQLAFRIDIERGFRAQPDLDWSTRSFGDLPLRRRGGQRTRAVSLEDIVDAKVRAPETWIEPADERGRVRFTSEARLVVQEFGDLVPRQEGTTVEVPYGTVVRAGPVLLAPLYVEQSDALLAGSLRLPLVGEGSHEEERISLFDDELQRTRRSLARQRLLRLISVFALLVLLAAVGVIGWRYASRPPLRPERVAIELNGVPTELRRDFYQEIRQRLQHYGFEAVSQTERSQSTALESAGQRLRLEVEQLESRRVTGEDDRQMFFALKATVTIESSQNSAGSTPRSLVLAREAPTFADAVDDASEDILTALLPPAVTSLAEAVTAADFAGFGDRNAEQWRTFKGTWRLADSYRLALRDERRQCARSKNRAGRGPAKVLNSPCQWQRLIGFTPQGKALIIDETPATSFTLGAPPKRGSIRTAHRVDLVDLETREVRTVARAMGYKSVAGLSRDGRRLFVVEEERDGALLVDIDVATGERQVLRVIGKTVINVLEPSPRGRYVAYSTVAHEGHGSCFHHREVRTTTLIMDRDTGQTRRIKLPQIRETRWLEGAEIDGTVHSPVLAVSIPLELAPERDRVARNDHLALIDPRNGEVLRRIEDNQWRSVSLVGEANGDLLFSLCKGSYRNCRRPGAASALGETNAGAEADSECFLGRLDLRSGETRFVPLQECLGWGAIIAGRYILYQSAGPQNHGLQAVDHETGQVRLLTDALLRPVSKISPDGSTAYYSTSHRAERERWQSDPIWREVRKSSIYRLDLEALLKTRESRTR